MVELRSSYLAPSMYPDLLLGQSLQPTILYLRPGRLSFNSLRALEGCCLKRPFVIT